MERWRELLEALARAAARLARAGGRALARGARGLLRSARGALAWVRGGGPGRLVAVLPAAALVLWLAWIAVERTGVRAGLEDAARDLVAMHRVRGFRDELRHAGREAGVDPYLLAGILWAESSGRVDAISSAGALGLFQLKPITYEWRAELMGLPKPSPEDILSDPLLSARLAADNVAWLLDTYDGDVERMLFAYNAGPGRLKQLEDEAGGWRRLRRRREGGVVERVFAYVEKVQRYAEAFRQRDVLGDDVELAPPLLNAPE